METEDFSSLEIAALYQSYPEDVRRHLLALRQIIYDVSNKDEAVGSIEECLKWGVPSYQTMSPKSGTPIRLQWLAGAGRYGVFVHCQTTLVDPFRQSYPDLTYDKNRGILFERTKAFPESILKDFISRALRYRLTL